MQHHDHPVSHTSAQPYTATEEQLRAALEECGGPVRGVRIVRNSTTGKPRGYAFAEFESSAAMHREHPHAPATHTLSLLPRTPSHLL